MVSPVLLYKTSKLLTYFMTNVRKVISKKEESDNFYENSIFRNILLNMEQHT